MEDHDDVQRVRVGIRLSRSTLRRLRHVAADGDESTGELIERVMTNHARDYDRDVREIPMQRPGGADDEIEEMDEVAS